MCVRSYQQATRKPSRHTGQCNAGGIQVNCRPDGGGCEGNIWNWIYKVEVPFYPCYDTLWWRLKVKDSFDPLKWANNPPPPCWWTIPFSQAFGCGHVNANRILYYSRTIFSKEDANLKLHSRAYALTSKHLPLNWGRAQFLISSYFVTKIVPLNYDVISGKSTINDELNVRFIFIFEQLLK